MVKSVSEPRWSGGEASVTLKFLVESTFSKSTQTQTTDFLPVSSTFNSWGPIPCLARWIDILTP